MRAALIVDDDAVHVMNTQSLLEPLGFDLIDAVQSGDWDYGVAVQDVPDGQAGAPVVFLRVVLE